MKLFLLVALTMTAFAANSVLNRVAVDVAGMDPWTFAVIRVGAGTVTLAILVILRGRGLRLNLRCRAPGALALAIYMIGFSYAYLTLGAGLGALVLFGVIQMVMFAFAVLQGQNIAMLRWVGSMVSLLGLAVLLWPAADMAVPGVAASAMIAAGIAWAAYTLLGQGATDALGDSAGNFLLCLPLVALTWVFATTVTITPFGALLAVISGAVTSGLGYALWYRILPNLPTTLAATAQLSVPVLAVLGGVIFLKEPLTLRLVLSGGLVLGGIALSLGKPQRTIGSNGS